MPYYLETDDRDLLKKLRLYSQCKECGSELEPLYDLNRHLPYLQCKAHPEHEGIEREASQYEKEGLAALNIETRRGIMSQEFGGEKTKALEKYTSPVTITKAIATEIVETLWGVAPLIEKRKAILLCQTYQLNPLMKHIYLIPYKRRDKNGKYIVDKQGNYVLDWSMQIGIGATRLMAQRKHNYSYLDLTPRKATEEEIRRILGDTADPASIYGFVHIKDVDTHAEAFGLRGIPKNEKIKGTDKGNTHLNMACIRSERLALDRQYPGEMPQGIEVVDERFMEVNNKAVDRETGEITEHSTEEATIEGQFQEVEGPIDATAQVAEPSPEEHRCEKHNCKYDLKRKGNSFWYSHKIAGGGWCNEKEQAATKAEVAEQDIDELWPDEGTPEPESPAPAASESEPVEEAKCFMDMKWLDGALNELKAKKLKYGTESNLLGFMKTRYHIEAETVREGARELTQGQAAHFAKAIQDILDMA